MIIFLTLEEFLKIWLKKLLDHRNQKKTLKCVTKRIKAEFKKVC